MKLAIVTLIMLTSTSALAIDCRVAKPVDSAEHWSWRMIDGRRCWYAGQPGMSKSKLRWVESAQQQGGQEGRDRDEVQHASHRVVAVVPDGGDVDPDARHDVARVAFIPARPGSRATQAPALIIDEGQPSGEVWPDLDELRPVFIDRFAPNGEWPPTLSVPPPAGGIAARSFIIPIVVGLFVWRLLRAFRRAWGA